MMGVDEGGGEDGVDQQCIGMQLGTSRDVTHDIFLKSSALEAVLFARELDLKAEMVVEEADHEVQKVMDDARKCKELVLLHPLRL